MENKWYHSSTGTGSLSLAIRGALVALVPIIIAVLNSQGFSLEESMVVEVIDSVFALVAAGMVTFGLGRKLYYKLTRE